MSRRVNHQDSDKKHVADSLFIFSYSYTVEKVLFLSQIFKVEILMHLHILRGPESDNHIFSR